MLHASSSISVSSRFASAPQLCPLSLLLIHPVPLAQSSRRERPQKTISTFPSQVRLCQLQLNFVANHFEPHLPTLPIFTLTQFPLEATPQISLELSQALGDPLSILAVAPDQAQASILLKKAFVAWIQGAKEVFPYLKTSHLTQKTNFKFKLVDTYSVWSLPSIALHNAAFSRLVASTWLGEGSSQSLDSSSTSNLLQYMMLEGYCERSLRYLLPFSDQWFRQQGYTLCQISLFKLSCIVSIYSNLFA